MMWVSPFKDGNMYLRARAMVSKKAQQWAKTNKRPPRGSPYLVPENDSIMVTPPHATHARSKKMNEHHKIIW
jgi:hypothetical protein